MSRANSLVLAVALTMLAGLGACHQTFTPPDKPDLAKVPLQFAEVDLSGEQQPGLDLSAPIEKDLSVEKPDLSVQKD